MRVTHTTLGRVFATLLVAFFVLAAPNAAGARSARIAVRAHAAYGAGAMPRPTLEQLAYHYWGDKLEAACPNGSLRFRRVPPTWGGVTDEEGGSWGDCHPYVRREGRRWPEVCASAIHETGHERGLDDVPGEGGIMDNTRMVVGSLAILHTRSGRVIRAQSWTGIPNVCQPGYRIPASRD